MDDFNGLSLSTFICWCEPKMKEEAGTRWWIMAHLSSWGQRVLSIFSRVGTCLSQNYSAIFIFLGGRQFQSAWPWIPALLRGIGDTTVESLKWVLIISFEKWWWHLLPYRGPRKIKVVKDVGPDLRRVWHTFFFFLMAVPTAHGSSLARIESEQRLHLDHSCSNAVSFNPLHPGQRSIPCLPRDQATAAGFFTCCTTAGTSAYKFLTL